MVLNQLIYCRICNHLRNSLCMGGDAVWRQGTLRSGSMAFCVSVSSHVNPEHKHRERDHSLPLGLLWLKRKQFKTDVEYLGDNNGILIWWESLGLQNIPLGPFYTLYLEVIGKNSSIIEFRCFHTEAEIVFRVLIWRLLFQLSPKLVSSKEGATLLVQEHRVRTRWL